MTENLRKAKKGMKQAKLNAVMFSMILEELLAGPSTCQHIAEHTGLHLLTVQRLFRALHRRGVVHIAAYDKDCNGRRVVRVFGLGDKKDFKLPKPTGAERYARYKASKAAQALRDFGKASNDSEQRQAA